MKTQDIRNMGLAYVQVLEASKKKLDPVGKEDGDIDNDGDKDKSDSYLHNRRKAISANIKKEEVEQVDEISNKTVDSYWKKASAQIKDPKTDLKTYDKRVRGLMTVAMKSEEVEQVDEISRDLARRYIRKVADKTNTGELDTKQVMKRKPGVELAGKKAYPGIAGKARVPATESTEWPIFARIQEKVNQTKGATKPESMEDRLTASDKKMVDGHGGLGAKTPEDFVDDNMIDKNANLFNAANVKAAPKRHNDQTVGDKTMPKAK